MATEHLELVRDTARVVVDVTRGGRLASLEVAGRELLVAAPDAADRSMRWGSFLMAPWPGRLANGRIGPGWRLDHGRGSRALTDPIQLARNHGRHAIHGAVFDVPWQIDAASRDACGLSVALGPRRWPFPGRVRQRLALRRGRLDLAAEVEADAPMPAALGWHPWFLRARHPGDDPRAVRVRLRAGGVLERQAMIPTGRVVAPSGSAELGDGPALGSRRLDDAYVDVFEPPVIDWPDGFRLTLEIAPPLSTVTVYTPRDALCVEPQTAWPNALGLTREAGLAAGAMLVEPERPLRAAWSLRWA